MVISIKVGEPDEELAEKLDSYLRIDPISNFYPLYDLHDELSRRKTFWCIGFKDGHIAGFLLVYRGVTPASIILDGDRDVIPHLLDAVAVDEAAFHLNPTLRSIVRDRFPIRSEYATEIMSLRMGEETLYIRHDVKLLNESHTMDLLRLMREWRPTSRDITDDEVRKTEDELKSESIYGIFMDGQLVSVIQLEKLLSHIPEVCWIGRVFTSQKYRGMGFATSLVSKAVEEAFKHESVKYVGLGVRSDNAPAKHVYARIGFKKYKDRCWLNLNTEIVP